jgi:nucleoside-diphosphate-sugar epimerase
MTVLVTGGTGFIGGYLVERLTKEGYEVVCIVRGSSDQTRLKRMAGVSIAECDINDEDGISKIVKKNAPGIVFHCAASVMERNESVLNRVNADGTRNICSSCLDGGVERMIYMSSVAVISGNKEVCLKDDMPYMASNAYGRSKIKAEKIAVEYRRRGLNTAIIRPCMVYGVGEPHMLYKIFALIKKRWLPLLEIPEMDSCLQLAAVENVVEALVLAMRKDAALEGTFLIADDEVITLKNMLRMLYKYLGGKRVPVIPGWLSYILLSMPGFRDFKGRFKNRTYDISRAERELGYIPEVKTSDGLKLVADKWMEGISSRNAVQGACVRGDV